MKFLALFSLSIALLLASGCKPKPKEIPAIQRKEAANLVSEAQFANTLRDYARAEPLFAKAAELCPDEGDYWVNLGVVRRRLGDTSGAKAAYESARKAYRDAFEIDPKDTDMLLQQVYVTALLGKVDEARSMLEKAGKKMPDNRNVRLFIENKQFDRIVEDPAFKEVAL